MSELFCPLCETSHDQDMACSIRGLAAVKERGLEKSTPWPRPDEIPSGKIVVVHGGTSHMLVTRGARKKPKPSKAQLKAIIAQLENEKKERRKRKAASQMRWRNKKKGKDVSTDSA